MTIHRGRLVGVFLVATLAALAACGSDSDVGGSGTHLTIEGVATATTAFVPTDPNTTPPAADDPLAVPTSDPSDGVVPTTSSDPGAATEISISGTLTCDPSGPTGTGMYAANAADLCAQVTSQSTVFQQIEAASHDACSQVYGGPQHVSIEGAIDGKPVDVTVDRSDGCGIEDWTRLEFLLGPPER